MLESKFSKIKHKFEFLLQFESKYDLLKYTQISLENNLYSFRIFRKNSYKELINCLMLLSI